MMLGTIVGVNYRIPGMRGCDMPRGGVVQAPIDNGPACNVLDSVAPQTTDLDQKPTVNVLVPPTGKVPVTCDNQVQTLGPTIDLVTNALGPVKQESSCSAWVIALAAGLAVWFVMEKGKEL